jgi:hypothetical protein
MQPQAFAARQSRNCPTIPCILARFFLLEPSALTAILKHMTHLGWVLPAIGGFFGGILATLFGHVGKYSLDKASELKELNVKIRREIAAFKDPNAGQLHTVGWKNSTGESSITTRINVDFPTFATDLESKIELIRWYALIRFLHLAQLPPKKKVEAAAKLLRQLPVHEKIDGLQRSQEALSTAEEIERLLK